MADAIVDPRTVVVHLSRLKHVSTYLEHAETALAAMVSPDWLPGFFTYALLAVGDFHVLALEGSSHALRDATRVREGGALMGEDRQEAQGVEADQVDCAPAIKRDALDQLVFSMLPMVPVEDREPVGAVLPVQN